MTLSVLSRLTEPEAGFDSARVEVLLASGVNQTTGACGVGLPVYGLLYLSLSGRGFFSQFIFSV